MDKESKHHKKPPHEEEIHLDEEVSLETKNQETFDKETANEPSRKAKMITISDIELENLKNDLKEQKDKYLRVLAESENSRKRLQKDKQETVQYAKQNVILDFLSPIDHMENALKFTQNMSEDVKHWAIGFQMILTQFKDALTNNGVTPFDSVGKNFDPHRHEAVEAIATEDMPPGRVIDQSLVGYIMGDKVIRPARVRVSKAISKAAEKQSETDSDLIAEPFNDSIDHTIDESKN